MKKDLISLLIKEVCQDRMCENCSFWKPNDDGCYLIDIDDGCYLIDIIEIIKNNEKENDNYEK